jgi:putative membrane protein insertion efficiency factor
MDKIVIWLIEAYQKTPSRHHSSCRFLPTCSQYTKEAVIKYGSLKGIWYGIVRISRCHPWQKGGYDPVK